MRLARSITAVASLTLVLSGCAVVSWVKPEPTVTAIETGPLPTAAPTTTMKKPEAEGSRLKLSGGLFSIGLAKGAKVLTADGSKFSESDTAAMEPLAQQLNITADVLAQTVAASQGGAVVIGDQTNMMLTVTGEAAFPPQTMVAQVAEAQGMTMKSYASGTMDGIPIVRSTYEGPGSSRVGEISMIKPDSSGAYHLRVVGSSADQVSEALDFIEQTFKAS